MNAAKIEFGDFQTPDALAGRVVELLARLVPAPRAVVEPTCGLGAFLEAAARAFPSARLVGVDVNAAHVAAAGRRLQSAAGRSEIVEGDFFTYDWRKVFDALPEPVLVLGNPPWVTNSGLGVLNSANLPKKGNVDRLGGLAALTGKANFDISEWMLRRLFEVLSTRQAVLALLVKAQAARRALDAAWTASLPIGRSSFYRIDSRKWFDATTEAGLLVVAFGSGAPRTDCAIHPSLEASTPESTFGRVDGRLVADLDHWQAARRFVLAEPVGGWRSGVKHDAAAVMELRIAGNRLVNGLGETVDIEEDRLFPLFKSSDVAAGRRATDRRLIVTQSDPKSDTAELERAAPKTWRYLLGHADRLDGRKSSIYRKRPRFALFGIGPYTFSPWKVAVSGLYRTARFTALGPIDGRAALVDDTVNMLPCRDEAEARRLEAALNSPAATRLFRAIAFFDAKRPLTVDLLDAIDLTALESATAEAGAACRPERE